jgi:hypothetical protein
MKHARLRAIWNVLFLVFTMSLGKAAHLRLHPENPHYFDFRGKPTVLITSGEHYGAVLNGEFDYKTYLATLHRDRLNLTRTFTNYRELPGAFGIRGNSMAAKQEYYLAPWARSSTPGYLDGGNKFDLNQWDPRYWSRLADFVSEAGRQEVIVEINVFSTFYDNSSWSASPMNASNNINGIGAVAHNEPFTLKDARLTAIEDAYIKKLVETLRSFDNIYYEICNEPYFGGPTTEWQKHLSEVISGAEQNYSFKHLISQNYANGSDKIKEPNPLVSIYNFHYAIPPDAVGLNYGLNRVIGDNETGFRGTNDSAYRQEAWDFIVAGGGLFNNLDYSFIVGHEDGTFVYPATQPGGGSVAYRRQLRTLVEFMHRFDFIHMKPDHSIIKSPVPPGVSLRALAGSDEYALYLHSAPIPAQFSARWTGELQPAVSGDYELTTFSNDGARVWVGDKLVIDAWTGHSDREDSGVIHLDTAKHYPLKIEYYQGGGTATMRLFWTPPGGKKELIPQSAFLSGKDDERGLAAEYFTDSKLENLKMRRTDGMIDFRWKSESPFEKSAQTGLTQLDLQLDPATYRVSWIDPASGRTLKEEAFNHSGGAHKFQIPKFNNEVAISIMGTANPNR